MLLLHKKVQIAHSYSFLRSKFSQAEAVAFHWGDIMVSIFVTHTAANLHLVAIYFAPAFPQKPSAESVG